MKHAILRAYLQAWLPILGRQKGRLVLVDGFAGSGRYIDGEDGSPLVMLKAYLDHAHRASIQAELQYLFIEKREDRWLHLDREVKALLAGRGSPMNLRASAVLGAFDDNLPAVLRALGGTHRASMFVFIDPFGYTGYQLEHPGRILSFPRCEVLIWVPLSDIARFVEKPEMQPTLRALFGDDRWKAARLSGDRILELRRLFASALGDHAAYVRSFALLDASGSHVYELFFGTQSRDGLAKMKTAMWTVDPGGGYQFRDPLSKGQQRLFIPDPDLAPLLYQLHERFETRVFTIEEAADFVLFDTPYLHDSHLKRRTLAPEERAGRLEVLSPRDKSATYPPHTRMRFRPLPPPAPE